jgi:hypothetical protein
MKAEDLDMDSDIVDLAESPRTLSSTRLRVVREIDSKHLTYTFRTFAGKDASERLEHQGATSPTAVYEHDDMPGKTSFSTLPSLVCRHFQSTL